jgi:hypothetical protein
MTQVRASRAYLHGFGTAGSLVAGTALLFVLASAVVAFKGWPEVSSGSTPSSVVIRGSHPIKPEPSDSRVGRVLTALASPVAAGAGAPAGHGGRPAGAPVRAGSGVTTLSPPSSTVGGGEPASSGSASCGSVCDPAGSSGVATTSSVPALVQGAANAAGSTVTSTGAALGAAVSGITSTLGGGLGEGNFQQSGSVVSGVGSTAGKTVSGASGTLGATITTAGHTVSGLLSSK